MQVIAHLALLYMLQADPAKGACATEYAATAEAIDTSWASPANKAAVTRQAAARRDECLRAHAEETRLAAGEKRRQEADAARAAAVAQVLRTPELMQTINSARLCVLADERRQALGVIARERKYSKLGGVVHVQRIADAQDEVAEVDDQLRQVKAALAESRQKPLACKQNNVAGLALCLHARRNSGDAMDPCQGEGIQIALRAVDESPY